MSLSQPSRKVNPDIEESFKCISWVVFVVFSTDLLQGLHFLPLFSVTKSDQNELIY